MKRNARIVFGAIVVVAMVMSMCFGQRLWGQDPYDSLRKASPRLAKLVPRVPTPASFVADVPDVIPAELQAVIDERILSAQHARLGDIGAAILPSIEDYAPAQVALAIYRTWRVGRIAGIGERERDLGVLILLVPKELAPNKRGECFILTGRGMEGIITDGTAAAICRDGIVPFMKERDYASALLAGIDSITNRVRVDAGIDDTALAAERQAEFEAARAVAMAAGEDADAHGFVGEATESGGGAGFVIGMTLAVFGLAGAGAAGVAGYRRRRQRKCPRCGNLMQRLTETEDDAHLAAPQQLEEQLKSVDYDVWQCNCGETLPPLPHKKLWTWYKECPDCHARTLKTTRRTITAATYSSSGLDEKKHHCESCGKTRIEDVVVPMLTESSSGSGSSDSSGGSSFGGSGSSSGGGGGSSY